MAMSDYSLSDFAAVTDNGRNNNGGWGDSNGWWIILLFIILGGWNGNRGWGGGSGSNGAGFVGGNELYPWMEIQQTQATGFSNLQQQLCNCCSDMQQTVSNGFFNAESSAAARQMANMQQNFGMQTAMMQGFNNLQAQQADCCCENRLATANQTATILAEHCADRNALQMGVRDIIDNDNRNHQQIIDKLCQLELDGVKNQLAQAQRENISLQNQLNTANFEKSQVAQNALITQGFADEVDALYNRLSNCPVPSMPVYGRTPIFQCQSQNGCNCGCNNF